MPTLPPWNSLKSYGSSAAQQPELSPEEQAMIDELIKRAGIGAAPVAPTPDGGGGAGRSIAPPRQDAPVNKGQRPYAPGEEPRTQVPAQAEPANPQMPPELYQQVANDPRFNTQVPPELQEQYEQWRQQNVPQGDNGEDYDYGGAFMDNEQRKGPNGHLTDAYKKPNHPTFSNESEYDTGLYPAGQWQGETFQPGTQPPSPDSQRTTTQLPPEQTGYSQPVMPPQQGPTEPPPQIEEGPENPPGPSIAGPGGSTAPLTAIKDYDWDPKPTDPWVRGKISDKSINGMETLPDGSTVYRKIERTTKPDPKDPKKTVPFYRVLTFHLDTPSGVPAYLRPQPTQKTAPGTQPIPHGGMQPSNPAAGGATPSTTPSTTPPAGNQQPSGSTPPPAAGGGGTTPPAGNQTPGTTGGTTTPGATGGTTQPAAPSPQQIEYEQQKALEESKIQMHMEEKGKKENEKLKEMERRRQELKDKTGNIRPFSLIDPKTKLPTNFEAMKTAVSPNGKVMASGKGMADGKGGATPVTNQVPLSIGFNPPAPNLTKQEEIEDFKSRPSFADNAGATYYGKPFRDIATTPGRAEGWQAMDDAGATQGEVRKALGTENSYIKNRIISEKVSVQEDDGSHLYPYIVGLQDNGNGTFTPIIQMSKHVQDRYAVQRNDLPTFLLGQGNAGAPTSPYDTNNYTYINPRADNFNNSPIVRNLLVPAYAGEKTQVPSQTLGTKTPLIFSDCPEPTTSTTGADEEVAAPSTDTAQWAPGVPFKMDVDNKTDSGYVLVNMNDGSAAFTKGNRNGKWMNERSLKHKDAPNPVQEILYARAVTEQNNIKEYNKKYFGADSGSPFVGHMPEIVPGGLKPSAFDVDLEDLSQLEDYMRTYVGLDKDSNGNVVIVPGSMLDTIIKGNTGVNATPPTAQSVGNAVAASVSATATQLAIQGAKAAIAAAAALKATAGNTGISAGTRNTFIKSYLNGLAKMTTGSQTGVDYSSTQSNTTSGTQIYVNPQEAIDSMTTNFEAQQNFEDNSVQISSAAEVALPWLLNNYNPRVHEYMAQNGMLPDIGGTYDEQAQTQQKVLPPETLAQALIMFKAGEKVDSTPLVKFYNKFMFPLLEAMYKFTTDPKTEDIRRDLEVSDPNPVEAAAIESMLKISHQNPWGFVPRTRAIATPSMTIADTRSVSNTSSVEVKQQQKTSTSGSGTPTPQTKYNSVVGNAGSVTAFDWRTKWKSNGGGATPSEQVNDLSNANDVATGGKGKQAANDMSAKFKNWCTGLTDQKRKDLAKQCLKEAVMGLSGAISNQKDTGDGAVAKIDTMLGGGQYTTITNALQKYVGTGTPIRDANGLKADVVRNFLNDPSQVSMLLNGAVSLTNAGSYAGRVYSSLQAGDMDDGLMDYGTAWMEPILNDTSYKTLYQGVARTYNPNAKNEEKEIIGSSGIYQSMRNLKLY